MALACAGSKPPSEFVPTQAPTGQGARPAQLESDDLLIIELATPPLAAPEGWSIDCRAPDCVANLAVFYESIAGGFFWEDAPVDYAVELDDFDELGCEEQATPPQQCVFAGDFDGDGVAEPLAWVREEATHRFDMLVGWRNRPPTLVGLESWAHVNATRHLRSCAKTLWKSARTFGDADELGLSSVAIGEQTPRDAFVVSYYGDRLLLWFDGAYWRNVELAEDELLPDLRLPAAKPWPGAPPPSGPRQCNAAKKLRRAAYRARNAKTILWFDGRKVARDPCTYDLDLDGDRKPDRASWVVVDGKTGLRVDWNDGRFAVLGAGHETPIDVLEGEPGCNLVPDAFNDSWDVGVAKWTGSHWQLPDGRTHVPLEHERIDGDALAITNSNGHVDLVFWVDGEWRASAVPFPWRKYRVFWPAADDWIWVHRPIPEVERYHRPKPVSRAWVRVETPGPPPKSPGFFAGY